MDSLVAALLQTDRLRLTPLDPADAAAMVDVLSSPDLYTFTGDSPPSLSELEGRYRAQVAGPTSGDETWLNWIVRLEPERVAVGFVQATVVGSTADVAWVIGVDWQSRGFATEAGRAMCGWLAARRVTGFTAHIHPSHVASQRVASAIGLQPTAEIDDDGEVVWASAGP